MPAGGALAVDRDGRWTVFNPFAERLLGWRADEILGKVLLSWHNIAFFQALTAAMREAISEGRFEQFRRDFRARHLKA